jgi:hypothetical protein
LHAEGFFVDSKLPSFPDRLRLPVAFDTGRLASDLESLASIEWIDHFLQDRYDGNWSVIPLRGPKGAKHPVMMIYADPSAHEFEDTPMLAHCPYFREIIDSLDCEVRAVRLMRLTPGSAIREHKDHDFSFDDGIIRIHIPVVTNADVEFLLNGSRVAMEAGSAWYLRLCDSHSVANKGSTDRVHMLIDAVLNDWLRALLERAALDALEPAAE